MTGKEICKYLRELRVKMAQKYGIEYTPHDCHHEGDCAGTCPTCESELDDLTNQIREKTISCYVLKNDDIIIIPENCKLVKVGKVPNIGIFGNTECKESFRYKIVKK